ncbi:DUF1643 domain-containing protein [Synechococcus sp. PCC 7335]|uniref:DUF1643 domain-containing protein n=1 Tax=Synechococcus sp. (strain ATCC 29403 / PCC 7335) TaxID=91464 RepID=UPI0003200C1C|nr:DUF1643 domain-containing protein [Synechococcus sp. PCC 7335]
MREFANGDLVERTAIFDQTGQYRYCLGRRWQSGGSSVAFVMLNPSQADASRDDPTLRACMQFAQRWEYAALDVVNLFGYRTPHPTKLKQVDDPIGDQNDRYLRQAVEAAERVVLAWGNWGCLSGRDRAILSLLAPYREKLTYLQLNRSGQPRHPLYIKRSVLPQRYPVSSHLIS